MTGQTSLGVNTVLTSTEPDATKNIIINSMK